MAINMQRARTLCTASEYELVRASGKREIGSLTPGRLRQKVSRARKLRDKYRDLASRQTGEMRGKRAPRSGRPAGDNRNTVAKAEIFQEALDRFEQALAASGEASAATPAHKKVTRRVSKKAGAAASKKSSKKVRKKASKKASKKTAKKSKKKAGRKKVSARKRTGAAALRSSAGGTGKKASRKKAAKKALPSRNPLKAEPAPQAAVETRRKKTSKRSRAARKDKHFAESGIDKNVRGVAGKTKRNQAKRDSRG